MPAPDRLSLLCDQTQLTGIDFIQVVEPLVQTVLRVFFVVERARFETLRGLLPSDARPSLKIEDETNNKLYLASATLK